MMDSHFTVVSKNDCSYCTKAKDLLEYLEYTYQEWNIDDDPSYKDFLRINSLKTVPQIWQGPIYIGGYTDLVEYLHETNNSEEQQGNLF